MEVESLEGGSNKTHKQAHEAGPSMTNMTQKYCLWETRGAVLRVHRKVCIQSFYADEHIFIIPVISLYTAVFHHH